MIDSIKTTEFPSSFINSVDWEHESQKDLVYLQEEKELFYRSLNDPGIAQIEVFMSDKINFNDLQILQETAKLNPAIPASIIVKGDKRLLKYYERKVDTLPF
jgi:hypothetical protein